MKKLTLLFFICILLNPSITKSELSFQKQGTFDIRFSGSYMSSSSFFDHDGKQTSFLTDTTTADTLDYLFTYRTYLFDIHADYFLTDNWAVTVEIPIAHYTLEEKYEKDDNGISQERANLSLTKPNFFGIGTRYRFLVGNFSSYVYTQLIIPPGFHDGIFDDSTYEFLDDGAFEFIGGIGLDYRMEKSRLSASVLYNHRAEELLDRVLLHAEAGLMTVPETDFMFFTNVSLPVEPVNKAISFDPHRTPVYETYVTGGLGFSFNLSPSFTALLSYEIRLWGQNTWALGFFTLSAGFKL